MTANPAQSAQTLKQLLIESETLIEEYTSTVCPNCTSVCCRQKHGTFRKNDIAYLAALGESVPLRDASRDPEGPCEVMGERGCRDPRWIRPFKCTWYFCEPLIRALDQGPQKKARMLAMRMQQMIDVYNEL
jgi:hypothetical protein